MTVIRVNSEAIDVIEQGSGKPLLLLHSLLADRSVFDQVVPVFARNRRVIVPDLPGFGGSSSAGTSLVAIADRLAGIFTALNLGTETDVLGNGLGGFIASMLAIRHGDKFDKLVLAGTGMGFTEQGRNAFLKMAELARKEGMESVVDIAMKRLFPDNFIAENPNILMNRRARFLKTRPTLFAEACEALAKLDLSDLVSRIVNPTLIVVGECDAATPPTMAHELVAAIKGSKLIELPGIGHAPMAQAPDDFVNAVANFLGLQKH
ncbi:alpha/beta fold hydrolase [Pseudorhodoplanes sp.]|uniref:alpha/beta fold hydrolase n=1 Tax=Pseudorhodoplanes sp. TaxID=1934341 RepID=UPI003D1090F4